MNNKRKYNNANKKNYFNLIKKQKEEEFTVCGYNAKLFNFQTNQKEYLIPCQYKEELLVDRYDIRNLLENLCIETNSQIQTKTINNSDEEYMNKLRFEYLDSEEEDLFDMDELEREEYVAEKRKRKLEKIESESNQTIETSSESEDDYRSLAPDGIQPPKNRKIFETIEKTAKFIENTNNPHMEIVIQTKQSGNPQFSFLNKNDPLNPFFLHIRKLLKMGLYNYSMDSDSDTEKESDKETEEAPPMPESNEILECIETVLPFIARNGIQLEEMLVKNHIDDPKYMFLNSNHKDHRYYKYRLEQCVKDPQPVIKYATDNVETEEQTISPKECEDKSTDNLAEEQKLRLARVRKFLESKK